MGRKTLGIALGLLLLSLLGAHALRSQATGEIAITVSPSTLLLGATQSGYVTVHADIAFNQVNPATLTLNDMEVASAQCDATGNLVVKVDENRVKATVAAPSATLTLRGATRDGVAFYGSDEVAVRNWQPGRPR